MYNFPVNVPSLLLLAWLASKREHREALLQLQHAQEVWRRRDGAQLIETIVDQELARVDPDHRSAPVFLRLLRHQIARIDLSDVEWALCGKNAVYLHQDALPSTANTARDAFAEQPVTRVLQEALVAQESLRSSVQSVLDTGGSEVERGGIMLHQWFLREAASWYSLAPGSFLVPELLHQSLEQVEWETLAAWLMDML